MELKEALTLLEQQTLDYRVQYLLERQLCRSKSKAGSLIDPLWLTLSFPRFYEYDILRGLTLVSKWSEKRQKQLSLSAIIDPLQTIARLLKTHGSHALPVTRIARGSEKTKYQNEQKEWKAPAPLGAFPLLKNAHENASFYLSAEMHALFLRLQKLEKSQLLKV